MAVEVALNTPLADALTAAIQPKLVEVGWGTGGAEDAPLVEYIILMLVNGKNQDEIASELAGDLLSLGPDDPGARDFARWLFEQVTQLSAQTASTGGDAMAIPDDSIGGSGDQDTEMNMATDASSGLNAPTGPKAMRNGINRGGGARERRMVGQINRAMDRTQGHDSVLHRTRGNDRINSHPRVPPNGPRIGVIGRPARGGMMNARAASIAHGMATAMGGIPPPPSHAGPPGPGVMNGGMPGMGMNGPWMAPGQPPQMDVFHLLEQQNQMIQQMQHQMNQQMMMQHQQQQQQQRGAQNGNFNRQGKPLFERVQHPNKNNNFRRDPQNQNQQQQNGMELSSPQTEQQPLSQPGAATGDGEDKEMSSQQKREAPNPKETICKFNLNCTHRDCKFVHQSPAAPPGVTVDISDVCSFGAACKNHKCVGAHPSPAARVAHQSEQDCKFFPNCANPRCPFRHPNMPLCRNGADCSVPGCKFTHVKTMCKFHPCTNRYCTFKHEEGQRGTFQDKVWTADGGSKAGEDQHVSERKFSDESAPVEDVLPGHDSEVATEGVTV